MKKNYFMLLLMTVMMAVGGGKAWGQTTTTIYERGTSTAWSSGDLVANATNDKWSGPLNGNTGLSITSDPFLQVSARGKTTSATGTLLLSRTANTVVTLDAVWNVGKSDFPSNDNSTYFTYGGFSLNYFTRYATTKYSFNGSEKTISSVGNSSDVSIHIVVNSVNGEILEFSVSSGDAIIISKGDLGNSPAFSAGTNYDEVYIKSTNNVSKNNTRGYLKSITVKQKTQEVETADYTVKWACGNDIVKTETRNAAVGSDIALIAGDVNPFFNDSETVRYLYSNDDASGQTVASDGSSVVTITVREAAKYAYAITSSYEGTALEWTTSGEVWEDQNTVRVSYPRFQALGSVLVGRAPVNNDLSASVTVTEDGYTQDLTYTATGIENLYLLSEAENLETGLSTNATNFTSRVSNGAIIFGATGTLTTLPAGSYIFTLGAIGGDGNTHQVAYTVSAGETQIIEGTCTGNWLTLLTSEEFSLTSDTPITFTCSDPASNRGIDLIYIQKTADAQTTGYTINYQYEGETLQTETGDAVVGAEVNAQESITVTTGEGEAATTQTYYVAENQTTSMTIDADAANNVLNVALRLPLTGNVVINAVDGEGNILKSFTAEATEGGDKVNVYYTRAVEVDGVYYTVPAKNGGGDNYAIKKAYGEEPTEITYTKDEEISYYAESENLNKSRSYAAEGQAPSRASGGHWWRLAKNSHAYTPALEGGVYKVIVSGRGERAAEVGIQVRYPNGTLVGENTLSWGSSMNAEQFVEDVNVPEGCSVAVVNFTDGNNNLGLDYVILYKTGDAQTELVTITSAGAATYCSEKVLNFENSDVQAYYLKMDGDELMKSNAIMVVPANTGIYLEGAEGTYEIPIASENDNIQAGDNVLQGVIEETQVDAPIYVLMNESNGVGFYKTKNTFTVGAHTAYIPGSAVPTGVKALNINRSDDPTTAIRGISNDAVAGKDAVIYNLAGQRVTAPTKGIYIVNGKKVMVK